MDDTAVPARRMTYAELGAARGISAASAERLVRRRRWPKQVGNDGVARALVPLDEARKVERVRPGRPGETSPGISGQTSPGISGQISPQSSGLISAQDIGADIWEAVREAIRAVIEPLSAQLEHERRRADDANARADRAEERADQRETAAAARVDRAEQRADEAIARADRAEKRLDELLARQATPDSLPVSMQPTADAGSPSILVQRISDAPLGLTVPDAPRRRRWWRFGR